MQIVVTGGAGFIGGHLCRRLLKLGNKVICIDNLSTGSRVNIADLLLNPNFSFIKYDISYTPLNIQADVIFNLACPASPIHYQKDPIETIKVNTLGMINVLELARKLNATLIQASTSEIYGNANIHPQKESYFGNVNPIGIRSCYDEGKRVAESLCFAYNQQHSVNIKVIRLFNTYGPYMEEDDGRVIPNFITQALNQRPITIYGDGTQTRSFCYISDIVDALVRVINTSASITGPINIGNNQEITIKDLAIQIFTLLHSNPQFTYSDLPLDDPCRRCPDISLAKSLLQWTPNIKIQLGLQKTISYFKGDWNGKQ